MVIFSTGNFKSINFFSRAQLLISLITEAQSWGYINVDLQLTPVEELVVWRDTMQPEKS
jgi:hypothetical protein